MGAVRKAGEALQRGWLLLAFGDDGVYQRKWAVLDNGVLWLHRDAVCSCSAEQVVPLHDAEVLFPSAGDSVLAENDVAVVKLGSAGPELRMRAESQREHRRWTAAMLEAAQLWHARRQMALRAVLPAGPQEEFSLSPAVSSPLEGRLVVAQGLGRLLEQAGELRTRTRRAVTHTHCDLVLPRYLRRAVAAAVDRIWRTCGRARRRANAADPECLAVYDALLVLRDDAEAFATYCTLLRDLEAMLGGAMVGQVIQVGVVDPLPFGPLRCLAGLRDDLARMGHLLQDTAESALQRTALAALDTLLQRCWRELSEQRLELERELLERAGERSAASSPCPGHGHGGVVLELPSDDVQPTKALNFKGGSTRVRRLASCLQRDVVRMSVRRARNGARTEGLALLDSLEMTPLPSAKPSPPSADAQPDRGPGEMTPQHRSPTPSSTAVVDAVDCRAKAPELADEEQKVVTRATAKSSMRWLRRRQVCSAPPSEASEVERLSDQDGDDEDISDGYLEVASTRSVQCYDECEAEAGTIDTPNMAYRALEEAEEPRRRPSAKNDPSVLDIPVTPATPNGGGRRALWRETLEVQGSGLLDRLNTNESALQEAKFEVLSSEESYLRALDLLAHRVQAIETIQDPGITADSDWDAVLKFLDSARACSLRFVCALRALWSLDMLLRGLCTLMLKESSAGASLQQYVHIVSLQPRAARVLIKIGSLEARQLVPLLSLPAQRATRLPLLLAAILRRLDQRSSEATVCRAALDRLNQIVFECNEALRRAEHTERITEFGRILLFEKSPSKKKSWHERKNSVIGRAKSFFLKSHTQIGTRTNKVLSSTSSMLHLS